MTETVEYTSANLTAAQATTCEAYEAKHENNQARVERFTEDGSAVVHLHSADSEPRIVHIAKDGSVPSEGEE